ncbi:hypothetical protein OHS33_17410 [Streptomyces sp. NBC_00536]|uniref:hypothetical protein n=1 Tax=Streptomyces sp. NBC_00536 TaxID=2975769 RepID=UPI002E813234|nr:hypothetical protein [Streptomyces sp. NBC_00536]WUC79960.1 hypothetical protein OHS33_17410 [Streptomyces sp. NBC_00536]
MAAAVSKAKIKVARRVAGVLAAGVVAFTGTLVGAGSAQAAYDSGTRTMWNDEPLYKGWHVDNIDTRLIMQDDGNLVLYRGFSNPATQKATWASNTAGCGEKAVMQTDGNLVVYGQGGRVCYALNEFKGSYANACLTVFSNGFSVYYTNLSCPEAAPTATADHGVIIKITRRSDAY